MKPLEEKIAVVAGATRGAGRGVARMLGESGATVYCTGRGTRAKPSASGYYAGRPETIEETAEMVDTAGGLGIPIRVDHAVEKEVAALFRRVKREQGRLDVLVNVLGGAPVMSWSSFTKIAFETGRALFDSWVWPHVLTCRHAVPLMVAGESGLIVEVTELDKLSYRGQLFYDLVLISLKRLVYALAEELAPHGVTALAITPGFMRTEAILDSFGVTETNWREAAVRNQTAKRFGFIGSETPCFVGRAVAALAADPDVAAKSGGCYTSWGLSEEYGFTDVDGERPSWWRFFSENFPEIALGKPQTGRLWEIAESAG